MATLQSGRFTGTVSYCEVGKNRLIKIGSRQQSYADMENNNNVAFMAC